MRYAILISLLLLFCFNVYSKNYKGAELRTREAYLYGRFSVTYKASRGAGQTSTFFTYNDQPNTPWNEIDIEILGRYSDEVQFNTITPNQKNHVRHQYVDFDPGLDFHTYDIEWTPTYVAWFIDGEEVARQTGEHIEQLRYEQKIMMNIWNPVYKNWVGELDDRALPFFAYYDQVSYSAYTPGEGDCGTDLNFTHQWTDSFDTFDSDRWQKATHTFAGNNADFIPENCVFQDGKMILCLTDNHQTGYTDKNPPAVQWAAYRDTCVQVRFSETVTTESAEDTDHYVIPGLSVQSAELLKDRRTASLRVPNFDPAKTYNLVCLNVVDIAEPPNSLLGQTISILQYEPLVLPVKINVGGSAFQDFLPDQDWTPETTYGVQDGSDQGTVQRITGTETPQLYRSYRQGLAAYRLRLANGLYQVTLHFAENIYNNAGERQFDVYINDARVITDLDIARTADKHHAFPVVIHDVPVTNKILNIHFSADIREPVLCGLEIQPLSTSVRKTVQRINPLGRLHPAYPNPFNDQTTIRYTLGQTARVTVMIYDLLGQLLYKSTPQQRSAGSHRLSWNADTASGIYIVRLRVDTAFERQTYSQKLYYLK